MAALVVVKQQVCINNHSPLSLIFRFSSAQNFYPLQFFLHLLH